MCPMSWRLPLPAKRVTFYRRLLLFRTRLIGSETRDVNGRRSSIPHVVSRGKQYAVVFSRVASGEAVN